MLMHAAINNTDIVPSGVAGATNSFPFNASIVGSMTVVVLWVCAAFFLVSMRRSETQRSVAGALAVEA
jgi:hypothetical protein